MIVGIGTDLANIDRIQGVLSRHGDRFKIEYLRKPSKLRHRDEKMKQELMQNAGPLKRHVLRLLALV